LKQGLKLGNKKIVKLKFFTLIGLEWYNSKNPTFSFPNIFTVTT
jgi:hypothetical protein